MTTNRRNYYRVLHVQWDAPQAVVKSSYRALMLSLDMHPDRGGEHWDAALINEAYGVLSNPATRAEYDVQLAMTRRPGHDDVGRPADAEGGASEATGVLALSAAGAHCCLFCGADLVASSSMSAADRCPTCKSPLTPAEATPRDTAARRALRRVAREGEIRYYTGWPLGAPERGRIVDLSPGGLRFESAEPIELFRILKLEGPLLDAVARVVNCRESGDSYATGVHFYTVQFHQSRGTFFSTTA